MEKANLSGTYLEGAFLAYATGLTRKQRAEAIIDEKTILPGYLQEKQSEDSGPEGND